MRILIVLVVVFFTGCSEQPEVNKSECSKQPRVYQMRGDCYRIINEWDDKDGKGFNDEILCINQETDIARSRIYFSNSDHISAVCYQSGIFAATGSNSIKLTMPAGICDNGRSYRGYEANCSYQDVDLHCTYTDHKKIWKYISEVNLKIKL